MFELQDKLNGRFGWSQTEILALTEEEQLQRVRNFLEVLIIESGETLKAARGRWWKKDKDYLGKEHITEECVDMWHFLMSVVLANGGTAEDFYQTYLKKNQHNHVRKDWKINESRDPQNDSGESKTS